MLLKWYFSMKKALRKIQIIFDIESWQLRNLYKKILEWNLPIGLTVLGDWRESSQLIHKRTSINDVRRFLTIFDAPNLPCLTMSSQNCRFLILLYIPKWKAYNGPTSFLSLTKLCVHYIVWLIECGKKSWENSS